MKQQLAFLVLTLSSFLCVFTKVYFEEGFNDSWRERWKQSTWKRDVGTAGEWKHTSGLWYGDKQEDVGIQTYPDARFFNIYTQFEEFTNKDKDLVIQFTAKHEQDLDCGGGYLKLIPSSSSKQIKDFSGETKYSIMFGPDICGYNKKVHVILGYKGKNYERKYPITAPSDRLTHIFTLLIKPDNTYKVLVDNKVEASGSLYEDWEMLEPKTIKDPKASKPADWEDEEMISDPDHKKPDDWDSEPEYITDSSAKKPEDWDEEEDGQWEAPQIKNPKYKGSWQQNQIKNPKYKGSWQAPTMDNPKFVDDPELYVYTGLKYLGFELWQVKSGSLFDNILLTDDFDYAMKKSGQISQRKIGEQKMYDSYIEKEKEELAKKSADTPKGQADQEDDVEEEVEASLDDDVQQKIKKAASDDDEDDEL